MSRSHRHPDRLLPPALLVLIAACSKAPEGPAAPAAPPVEPPPPGVYTGTFPCDGCPGIEVTLWLRDDGRFFLRQHYLASAASEAGTFHALGRWTWREDDERLALAGGGPERVFAREGEDGLGMETTTGLPHRLSRLADSPAFADTLRLEGEFELGAAGPEFRECRTALVWPVASGADYRRLRHQYGTLPRGSAAFVTADARLAAAVGGEALVIEKLIRLEEERRCP